MPCAEMVEEYIEQVEEKKLRDEIILESTNPFRRAIEKEFANRAVTVNKVAMISRTELQASLAGLFNNPRTGFVKRVPSTMNFSIEALHHMAVLYIRPLESGQPMTMEYLRQFHSPSAPKDTISTPLRYSKRIFKRVESPRGDYFVEEYVYGNTNEVQAKLEEESKESEKDLSDIVNKFLYELANKI